MDGVSFSVQAGEAVALLGESGCGKSLTALTLMGLLPAAAEEVSGSIRFAGEELVGLSEQRRCELRGSQMGMVFQDPSSTLNPLRRIGAQVSEASRLRRKLTRTDARALALELLKQVGIPSPETRLDDFPHQLSGGMRQRMMIAIAIAQHPPLLIADEPTTALDVTVQAQVLGLLSSLRHQHGMAMLLITHDLGVVNETCDQVLLMYAGKIVERAQVSSFFAGPHHPYGAGLLRSLPARQGSSDPRREKLWAIPGTVPSLKDRSGGCRYKNRCERATTLCAEQEPLLARFSEGGWAACHHPLNVRTAAGEVASP